LRLQAWLSDPAAMNLALLLLVPASAAMDLSPPTAPAAVAAVTTYDAIVAIEETPPAKDLTKPAVFIEDSAAKAIVSASGTRWIA
jgi:hypothetical protein